MVSPPTKPGTAIVTGRNPDSGDGGFREVQPDEPIGNNNGNGRGGITLTTEQRKDAGENPEAFLSELADDDWKGDDSGTDPNSSETKPSRQRPVILDDDGKPLEPGTPEYEAALAERRKNTQGKSSENSMEEWQRARKREEEGRFRELEAKRNGRTRGDETQFGMQPVPDEDDPANRANRGGANPLLRKLLGRGGNGAKQPTNTPDGSDGGGSQGGSVSDETPMTPDEIESQLEDFDRQFNFMQPGTDVETAAKKYLENQGIDENHPNYNSLVAGMIASTGSETEDRLDETIQMQMNDDGDPDPGQYERRPSGGYDDPDELRLRIGERNDRNNRGRDPRTGMAKSDSSSGNSEGNAPSDPELRQRVHLRNERSRMMRDPATGMIRPEYALREDEVPDVDEEKVKVLVDEYKPRDEDSEQEQIKYAQIVLKRNGIYADDPNYMNYLGQLVPVVEHGYQLGEGTTEIDGDIGGIPVVEAIGEQEISGSSETSTPRDNGDGSPASPDSPPYDDAIKSLGTMIADGDIEIPGGETLTNEELIAIRDENPDRDEWQTAVNRYVVERRVRGNERMATTEEIELLQQMEANGGNLVPVLDEGEDPLEVVVGVRRDLENDENDQLDGLIFQHQTETGRLDNGEDGDTKRAMEAAAEIAKIYQGLTPEQRADLPDDSRQAYQQLVAAGSPDEKVLTPGDEEVQILGPGDDEDPLEAVRRLGDDDVQEQIRELEETLGDLGDDNGDPTLTIDELDALVESGDTGGVAGEEEMQDTDFADIDDGPGFDVLDNRLIRDAREVYDKELDQGDEEQIKMNYYRRYEDLSPELKSKVDARRRKWARGEEKEDYDRGKGFELQTGQAMREVLGDYRNRQTIEGEDAPENWRQGVVEGNFDDIRDTGSPEVRPIQNTDFADQMFERYYNQRQDERGVEITERQRFDEIYNQIDEQKRAELANMDPDDAYREVLDLMAEVMTGGTGDIGVDTDESEEVEAGFYDGRDPIDENQTLVSGEEDINQPREDNPGFRVVGNDLIIEAREVYDEGLDQGDEEQIKMNYYRRYEDLSPELKSKVDARRRKWARGEEKEDYDRGKGFELQTGQAMREVLGDYRNRQTIEGEDAPSNWEDSVGQLDEIPENYDFPDGMDTRVQQFILGTINSRGISLRDFMIQYDINPEQLENMTQSEYTRIVTGQNKN